MPPAGRLMLALVVPPGTDLPHRAGPAMARSALKRHPSHSLIETDHLYKASG
jgi:hypothetical protein